MPGYEHLAQRDVLPTISASGSDLVPATPSSLEDEEKKETA